MTVNDLVNIAIDFTYILQRLDLIKESTYMKVDEYRLAKKYLNKSI